MSARDQRPWSARWPLPIAVGLTWLVLTAAVVVGTLVFREQIRDQILGRDAELMHRRALSLSTSPLSADDPEPLGPGEILTMMSDQAGLIAASLYRSDGAFWEAVSMSMRETEVPSSIVRQMRDLRPVGLFEARARLSAEFKDLPEELDTAADVEMPLVRVYVPLQNPASEELGAILGFVYEGLSLQAEFRRLDRRLVEQAGLILLGSLALTGGTLVWAFRRLAWTNRQLERRTADLQRANQEISQTARVAALGAVTAHLMHSLKSPVTGLQNLMASRVGEEGPGEPSDWQAALAATQRMQGLIQQVARVVGDQDSDLAYEVPLMEIGQAVVERTRSVAEGAGVRLLLEGDARCSLDNRGAGLLSLALANLVENAIQASRPGAAVTLRLTGTERALCEVRDEGEGVSEEARARLFQPQRSSKEGGSGLGLAITRQLVAALGGTVDLAESGPRGSVFRVEVIPDRTAWPTAAAEDEPRAVNEHA